MSSPTVSRKTRSQSCSRLSHGRMALRLMVSQGLVHSRILLTTTCSRKPTSRMLSTVLSPGRSGRPERPASLLGWGIITLPAAIPANLASVLFIQLRLIAAIAKMRGYDVRTDQVKTLCVACLARSAASDIIMDVGIQVGTRLPQQAIAQIAGSTLVRINQAVGFRLVTKAGSTGIFNLIKMVPFLGGIVGGIFDAVATKIIGSTAKNLFTSASPLGGIASEDSLGRGAME